MKSDRHKNCTVNNNVNATHNLLNALFEADLDPHLVHPGVMGVCCYSTIGAAIPEGYLPVSNATMDGNRFDQDKLCHQCRLSRRCHRWLFPRGQLDLA